MVTSLPMWLKHFVPLFANLTTRWFFPNAKWCSQDDFIPSDNTNSVWLPESGPGAAKRWSKNGNELTGSTLRCKPGRFPSTVPSSGRQGNLSASRPLVRRIVAAIAGPMTFTGNLHLCRRHGAKWRSSIQARIGQTILSRCSQPYTTRPSRQFMFTHTHKDHSPGARALKAATGARILGCAPYDFTSRAAGNPIDAAHDSDYAPDTILRGRRCDRGQKFLAHLRRDARPRDEPSSLRLAARKRAYFSGDHVMACRPLSWCPRNGAMRTTWHRSQNF